MNFLHWWIITEATNENFSHFVWKNYYIQIFAFLGVGWSMNEYFS
jgi:hypothetical protein